MGLIDRDYTSRENRQQPFSPPPRRSGASTLGMVLIFIAILFALYKIADWKLQQRAAPHAGQPAAAQAGRAERATVKPVEPTPRPQPPQNTDDAGAATQRVTKCVANGKTSYGDGPCAHGATVSQIVTRSDYNLMAGVRPERVMNAAPTEERPSLRSAVAQNSPAVDTAAFKKAECKSLDAWIAQLDSMSRQPQGAQMQDWIRDERKKARDKQFRLSCA